MRLKVEGPPTSRGTCSSLTIEDRLILRGATEAIRSFTLCLGPRLRLGPAIRGRPDSSHEDSHRQLDHYLVVTSDADKDRFVQLLYVETTSTLEGPLCIRRRRSTTRLSPRLAFLDWLVASEVWIPVLFVVHVGGI